MHTIGKRKIFNPLLWLLLPFLLFLSACQTGSGYTQYRIPAPQAAPAQGAPRTLETSATKETAPPSENDPLQNSAQKMQNDNHEPVRVAILLPLSGPHADLGQSMLNAAQMALFDANYTNFKLIPRDTKGTASGAAQATQSAINDGAQLILGPLFAESVRTAKPIANRAHINIIAFSTDWTLAGNGTFIMGFLPFDQINRVTKFAVGQGIQQVGLLTPGTNYGRVADKIFLDLAPHYGMTITKKSSFVPHSSNLAPAIRAFADQTSPDKTSFDAVLLATGGEDARAIANLLSHNNLPPRKIRRLGTGLFDDPALASEVNLEGAWFAAPSPDMRRNFEKRYLQTFGSRPMRLSTLAYDATSLAITLAYTNTQPDRAPFNENALKNPNGFAGIDGIFRFRPDGTAERGLAVLSFKHGRIVIIDKAPRTF